MCDLRYGLRTDKFEQYADAFEANDADPDPGRTIFERRAEASLAELG
jgi:hypothetical protein